MTVGIVIVKGLPGKYEYTHEFLEEMKKKKTLENEKRVTIRDVFLSMGWPDIILLLEAEQVLDIHEAITYIKNELRNRKEEEYRDLIDTSTIVCIRKEKRKEIEREIAEYAARFDF